MSAAASFAGPQVYAYAAARPLRLIDATGLYAVDEAAWGGDQARIDAIKQALYMIRSSSELNCYFVRRFGRNPVNDDGDITPNDFWDSDTLGRGYPFAGFIQIDPSSLDDMISHGNIRGLASLLAHEMVHASFAVIGHDGASNPYTANSVFEVPGIFPEYASCGGDRCERNLGAGRFCAVCR